MKNNSIYYEAHLFVAAIRVVEHLKNAPPSLDQIAKQLNFSAEQAGLISRRLEEAGIIGQVEGGFGRRWAILDHVKLEALPRDTKTSQLDDELKKFQSEREKLAAKVESIKEEQEKKKKDLFAGIEAKLKKDLGKDSTKEDRS
jgi:DNA-binding Lrp family transcriptional regulator